MQFVLVGIGGFFGSISRYLIAKYLSRYSRNGFPTGTFFVNISGAILLGILSGFQNHNIYLLLGDGFLGAFTTFSTFMYEGVTLINDNKRLNAVIYITISVVFGVLGFVLGLQTGKVLNY